MVKPVRARTLRRIEQRRLAKVMKKVGEFMKTMTEAERKALLKRTNEELARRQAAEK